MATDYIDFSKMKEGGGSVRVPEGDYTVKIKAIKPDTSQSGNKMLVFTFVGLDGKLKGKEIIDRVVRTENSLWKLRDILEAVGVTVQRKKYDTKKLIRALAGKELGVTIVDDEPYNGRIKSTVVDYISAEDVGAEDDEDEDDLEEDDLDEDDDELEEDDELADLSRVELKKLIKDESLDVTVRKSMSDDDLREAITAARDEDEDDDEDEEDEKPAPKKRRASKAKKKPADDDEDDIDEIDLDDL